MSESLLNFPGLFSNESVRKIKKKKEKRDKYIDLARELKKLWNMKVTVIPFINGALRTITKGFVKDWKTWK